MFQKFRPAPPAPRRVDALTWDAAVRFLTQDGSLPGRLRLLPEAARSELRPYLVGPYRYGMHRHTAEAILSGRRWRRKEGRQ